MSAKEFATQLKQTIQDIKTKGTAAIYCDNFIAYLDEISSSPSVVVTPAELEQYKTQLQLEVERNRNQHASGLEMFKPRRRKRLTRKAKGAHGMIEDTRQ